MENIKINIDNYNSGFLSDIYYSLMSYISKYAEENFNSFGIFYGDNNYANAVIVMKQGVKNILDYLSNNDEVYIPSLKRMIRLSTINVEEQEALLLRCEEYLSTSLRNYLVNNMSNRKV